MKVTVIIKNGEARPWVDVRPEITKQEGLNLWQGGIVLGYYPPDSWESFFVTKPKDESQWRRIANELAAALRLSNEMRDRALEEFKKIAEGGS